jgi:hypothetical protein
MFKQSAEMFSLARFLRLRCPYVEKGLVMYTSTELQLLRNADPGVKIPGVDTPTGNPLAGASLKPLSSIPTSGASSITYSPSTNTVYINQAGAVVSGYDFGNATIHVMADNVTIKDCSFEQTAGYYAIQSINAANLTVTNNTFTGWSVPAPLAAWVATNLTATVTNNSFFDTPADGVVCNGGGIVSGNYFSGGGDSSTGQHPDAIVVDGVDIVDGAAVPILITNNFIDWTPVPSLNLSGGTTDIFINDIFQSISNVTVTGNYLMGAANTVIVGAPQAAGNTYSNISVTGNYLGFGVCQDVYSTPLSAAITANNTIFDYTNSAYSTNAWTAYQAAGLPTANLLVSTGSSITGQSETAPTTLYGNGESSITLYGGAHENNYVGGYGRQIIFAGAGANIFTYLSPADSKTLLPDAIADFDPNKDVIDLSHIDANVTPGVSQNFAFIGTSAFTGAGAQVRYQLNPTSDLTVVQVALAGDTAPDMTIDITGLFSLTAANFALTSSQSKTDFANGAALSVAGVRAGSSSEYVYTNVQGQAYTSYTSIPYANNDAADDLNLSATWNQIDLYQNAMTLTRTGQAESLTIGASVNTLAYHAMETIQVGNAGAETFAFSGSGGKGYGAVAINGFAPSGTNADTLVLSTSDFSYLTGAMTQAQDLAAVLSHVSPGSNGMSIGDKWGDSVALVGVSAATLTANPGAVKFV